MFISPWLRSFYIIAQIMRKVKREKWKRILRRRAFGQAFREKVLTPDTFDSVNVGEFRGSKPAHQANYAANQSARSSLALAGLREREGRALASRRKSDAATKP
ncbi:hypothetical protein RASY3_07935 [Ruminococcus albus SY3]|uniref:Uncharacterized protein n=1 Tax=Ruminococcus albus SY3 TaxID=1341156 RepID=A0A011UHQ0_RUMAL|nr:hypothetical protein RASY3_07935 [Ruminococcus albus SY3]